MEKQVTMITETTLESEKRIRIFQRNVVQKVRSFKEFHLLPCDALFRRANMQIS
jgi:hypothetical protein